MLACWVLRPSQAGRLGRPPVVKHVNKSNNLLGSKCFAIVLAVPRVFMICVLFSRAYV